MLCQHLEVKLFAFHLGCVTNPQVGHCTVSHHDILAIQTLIVARQVGT